MNQPTTQRDYATEEEISAAREIIRKYGPGVVVSIDTLLEELGPAFPTTPDMDRLLYLIYQLFEDEDIVQVDAFRGIEFSWKPESR